MDPNTIEDPDDLPASVEPAWKRACSEGPLAGDSEGLSPASDLCSNLPSTVEGEPEEELEDEPVEELWRNEADGPLPTRRMIFGPPVPNLTRIHRDSWREVLLVLPREARIAAALNTALSREERSASTALALSLPEPPSETARAALGGGPRIPAPTAGHSRAGRQVNVRVAEESYESLQVAAKLLGGTPTQIARMLINNGVRRVLAEHDAAMDRARHPEAVRP